MGGAGGSIAVEGGSGCGDGGKGSGIEEVRLQIISY